MFVLLVVGGILMILLGFIGIYVGLIFQEVKRRPIYLVRQHFSGARPPSQPTQPVNPTSPGQSREPAERASDEQ